MPQKSRLRFIRNGLFAPACMILLIVCAMVSCRKNADSSGNPDIQVEIASYPSAFNFNCINSPVYEDSILCARYRASGSDCFAKPLNRTEKGKYYAWPAGLQIDVNSGCINITQSEPGVRYVVGFVKDGTTDTCHSMVIVAGIHYKDDIYVLQQNDSLAIPYFNASTINQAICDASGDDDYPDNNNGNTSGNNRCEFDDDEDDDNGNGTADEPPPGQQANEKFVRVRTKSGIINLKKSLEDGAFGQDPQNGATTDVKIYYRLNDCSQKALRSIKVRLIYYYKKTDVPPALLTEVLTKKSNFESYQLISTDVAPRPPLIIVTRF